MTRLILIPILFLFGACDKENATPTITPEATFFVTNNQETMPVWVHGKSDATCILLAVHGGPGSDVLEFRTYQNGSGFKDVEAQYLVAYWQQRASGQSYGTDNTSLFTIDQYIQDLDKVVDEIKTRYPNKKIALFGHSWGGMLTSSYLKDATRRAKINGWIDAAGATDATNLLNYSKVDLNAEADDRIALNENSAYWQDVKTQLLSPNTNVNALAYSVLEKVPQVTIKVNNADFKFTTRAYTSNNALFPQIVATDNSASLINFNKPVLMLWGKYDYAVSKQIRNKALLNLTNAQVTNIEMPASGHYMMFHEPSLFASTVINFLNSL
jgi:pimeloyl-ACP methyl ester carboxylesterase